MLDSHVPRRNTKPRGENRRSSAKPVRRLRSTPRRQRPTVGGRTWDYQVAGTSPTRPFVLLVVMVLCASGVAARLVYWCTMEHGRLAAAIAAEQHSINVQPPVRGLIFDAQNKPVAANVTMNDVYADTKRVRDPENTARIIAPLLQISDQHLANLLMHAHRRYVLLAQRVSDSVSLHLHTLALPGIVLMPQTRRAYPQNSLASQVLGYVDLNNKGNYGLEAKYDPILSGQAGISNFLGDIAGRDIRLSSDTMSSTRKGADLYLSIDRVVQGLAEDELNKAIRQHQADGGTILIMNPRTGDILGMASAPSFNPNHYATAARSISPFTGGSRFANPAIQWTYEPGSTFKILTMAAGLDSHKITPDSAFFDSGRFVVAPDTIIHNWNRQGFGWETMTQVLQHSANVGASWVANKLGVDRFYQYIHRFRLGAVTGVDLAGEEAGILPLPQDKSWTIANLYTNSYGQGISVTPLQMIRAIGSVANGGVIVKPRVVRRIVYAGRIIDVPSASQGRVISAAAARTLTNMLVRSAVDGEAKLALVPGYKIAAKTGTANIAGADGHYLNNATIASIAGYAPADNPRFVLLVIIKHPRDTPWGSTAAAPVLHNLFQELFAYYHIPPDTRAPAR